VKRDQQKRESDRERKITQIFLVCQNLTFLEQNTDSNSLTLREESSLSESRRKLGGEKERGKII